MNAKKYCELVNSIFIAIFPGSKNTGVMFPYRESKNRLLDFPSNCCRSSANTMSCVNYRFGNLNIEDILYFCKAFLSCFLYVADFK